MTIMKKSHSLAGNSGWKIITCSFAASAEMQQLRAFPPKFSGNIEGDMVV